MTDRGNPNNAYTFNKTKITVADNDLLDFTNSFSICAWFNNYNTSELGQGIVGKPRYDGGGGYFIQLINDGSSPIALDFGINSGTPPYGNTCHFSSDSLITGWHYVVGTYNGANLELYVDGKLKETKATDVFLPNSEYPLYIGRECGNVDATVPSGDTVRYFYGSIDDVRLYNRPLTQTEVESLFAENSCFRTIYDTVKVSVTDTLIITANLASGTNPPSDQNIIKAYPNPTNDHLLIHNGDFTKMTGYKIKIINSLGNQVFESVIDKQLFDIDLNTFGGKGLYYLQIIDNSSQIIEIKKIVLK